MGIYKTKQRMIIEEVNIIKLLETNTMQQIADEFNCTLSMVHSEANNQFSKLNIGFTPEIIKSEEIKSVGAWMNSKERVSIQDYKNLN